MTLPYDRKFNIGRGSEQLYGEELHRIYESIRHLTEAPQNKDAVPAGKLSGSIWFDQENNELNAYNANTKSWNNIFSQKFQITDRILSELPDSAPVIGQLWLYNDVLMYFNGVEWKPVKALEQSDSQFNISAFSNFQLVSPLYSKGNVVVDEADMKGITAAAISSVSANKEITIEANETYTGKDSSLPVIVLVMDDAADSETNGQYISAEKPANISYTETTYTIHNNLDRAAKFLVMDAAIASNYIKETFKVLTDTLGTSVNLDAYQGEIKKYQELRRKYIQGKIDYLNDAAIKGDGTKWTFDHKCSLDEVDFWTKKLAGNCQFLVPDITFDKVFLNHLFDDSYIRQSRINIEYPRSYLLDKTPSLVHINPGRITSITKRLIKIDRDNPLVEVPAKDTEFYGFHHDSLFGDFLQPSGKETDVETKVTYDKNGKVIIDDQLYERVERDYEIVNGGIYLSHNAAQNYDYILAVSYDFSWFKTTGSLNKVSEQETASSFYLDGYSGITNVFVNGYDLEEPEYTDDNMSQTITINDDLHGMEVSFMSSTRRESGFVRRIDLKNRAVIKVLKPFDHPLVFLGGEAMSSSDIEIDGNYIYVNGGTIDMPWSIIELRDQYKDENGISHDITMRCAEGNVPSLTTNEREAGVAPYIKYDPTKNADSNSVVLFVDGLLVKKEDIIRNNITHSITTAGLQEGQQYILLNDPKNRLYDSSRLIAATPVGHLSETMVYVDGHLICNDKAVVTIDPIEDFSSVEKWSANANGEIRFFVTSKADRNIGIYYIWNGSTNTWDKIIDQTELDDLNRLVHAYSNSVRAVSYCDKLNDPKLHRVIYAFNYANDIRNAAIIRNVPCSFQEMDEYKSEYLKAVQSGNQDEIKRTKKVLEDLVKERKEIHINETYEPDTNSLSVWVNGVRQYDVIEWLSGDGFSLPESTSGIITYMIETPESAGEKVYEREILTKDNALTNAVNMYRTTISLYPGKVSLYVDGLRLPQSAYKILDNHNILINDEHTMMIGSPNTYPVEKRYLQSGELITMTHTAWNKLLVEVRQNVDREERSVIVASDNSQELFVHDLDLPTTILEAADEILIFIDGLFFGLRNLIGYTKDKSRGSIRIEDAEILNRMKSSSLYTYLNAHPEEMTRYCFNHNGKAYEIPNREIILDWR